MSYWSDTNWSLGVAQHIPGPGQTSAIDQIVTLLSK